jgi:hypothetical protein
VSKVSGSAESPARLWPDPRAYLLGESALRQATVAVAQQEAWGFFVGDNDLLGGPFGVGMVGQVEVNESS